MKHFFAFRLFLLVCSLGLLAWQPAQASHAQGGQLTYSYVGTAAFPNRYRVELTYFGSCSMVSAGTRTVSCRAGSCNGTLVTGVLSPVGQQLAGQPLCASAQAAAPCNPLGSGSPFGIYNYTLTTYEAIVDLPPAAEWIISWEESARISSANLTYNGTLRLEATLSNLITPVGGPAQSIVNNSPVFSAVNSPNPLVPVNKLSTLSFSAHDNADRVLNGQADSLVFSLERPLNGCGTYETYAAYGPPTSCLPITLPPPSPQPCLLFCDIPGVFSPTLPLPVVGNDTVGACPIRILRPSFRLNASTGSFTFAASYWNPSANYLGLNNYVMTGKVTEYRKINGTYYKVGSVRRDLLVTVVQTTTALPNMPTATSSPASSGAVATIRRDTTDLTVVAGRTSQIDLTFTTPNTSSASTLTLYYDNDLNSGLLRGGALGAFQVLGNGTATPVGRFSFQPTAAMVGTSFVTTLRVEDDACPLKGVQYRAVRVRVRANTQALTTQRAQPGTSLSIVPNPTLDGHLNVLLTGYQEPVSLTLFDALGRAVRQARLATPNPQGTSQPLDIAPLPAGVYVLQVRTAKGVETRRIVRE